MALPLPLLPGGPPAAPVDNWHLVTVAQGQTLGAIFEELASLRRCTACSTLQGQALARLRPGAVLGSTRPLTAAARLRYDRNDTQRIVLSLNAQVAEKVVEPRSKSAPP